MIHFYHKIAKQFQAESVIFKIIFNAYL